MIKKIFRALFRKKVEIPSYEEKRAIILSYKIQGNTPVFVETGTFLGDTIESLKTEFDQLFSIELSEELAERAKERFAGDEHIHILQGSSDVVLPSILDQLETKAIFWLDGHYSGEFMYGDEYIKTAKGTLNTPILKELEQILNCNKEHIILIDDARLFNGKHDYPTIKDLRNILKSDKNKRELMVIRDIIRILPVKS